MDAARATRRDRSSRRALVRRGGLAVTVGSLVPLGGCLGGQPLAVEGVETEVVDGSVVVVLVGVTNESGSTASATVIVQCNVLSGDTYTDRREITVLAGQTTSYEFRFRTQQSDLGNGYQVATEIEMTGPIEGAADWLRSL